MENLKVGLINLGCDKNRIDSEIMLSKLSKKYIITKNPENADIIIVNTCGFIQDSKEESINSILEMSKYKKQFKCKVLVATGCLTQRYGKELLELIPEIDILLGVNNYNKLEESIEKKLKENKSTCLYEYSNININEGSRIVTTGKSSAYLRIAEGCNKACSYCIIPKIRGKYRSRKMENIINEAEVLAKQGVKEIILVAQDTTKYGIDLYNKKCLHELLNKISKIENIEWIRILYCYPEEIYDELLDEMASNKKVCNYLDIPIQHISNSVLKNMRRATKKEEIIDKIKKMREKIENVALRTSIIVGFPGETEEDFNELKDFITDIKFDKLGVFKYSKEEDTKAAEMENQISEDIKERRQEELMLLQQGVSRKINRSKIGKVYRTIIESKEEDTYYGRNYEMAPEIDGEIFIKCDKILNIGDMVNVKIIDSLEYDLIGVVCDESC